MAKLTDLSLAERTRIEELARRGKLPQRCLDTQAGVGWDERGVVWEDEQGLTKVGPWTVVTYRGPNSPANLPGCPGAVTMSNGYRFTGRDLEEILGNGLESID